MEKKMKVIVQERGYNEGVATDVDDAVEHGKYVVLDIDPMVDFMEKKLDYTRGKPSYRSATIFTIPRDIRSNDGFDDAAYSPKVVSDGYGFDDAAYSPKVVSIGLLQQRKLRLDEHKLQYLDKFLSRSKNNLKMYTKEMANIVVEAASCYSGCLRSPEPGYILEARLKEYVNIMLVDGCFLINLLLQLEDGSVEINDPIYSDRWTLPWVAHDMLLLQNQLPFFVLEKLWELTGRERLALKTNVLRFFQNLLPQEHDLKPPETEDVHHLLHLIHLSLQPASSTKNSSFESPKPLQPASPTEKPESASAATIPSPPQPSDTLSTSKNSPFESTESLQPTSPPGYGSPVPSKWAGTPFFRPPKAFVSPHDRFLIPSGLEQISGDRKMSEQPRPAPPPKTIPSATELHEAGVKLQRRTARSFLDVTFEHGLMQIPRLTISDSTNSLFRNFIAFEQGFPDCGNHFTSYCIFMDSLINTPRDVQILKQSGIITHVLGSDEEVALLFNMLCRGITWDYKNSYLAKVFKDVEDHTKKKWPTWRAKLVRDYFSNPWAILSLIAAIVILILTFLQTYFAVFSYFSPP